MLILASASPRRRELLAHLGLPFTVQAADIDETPYPDEDPRAYTERLAREKALAIAQHQPDATVLAADTTVVLDDLILGKPHDAADARRMLQMLQGRSHRVITGVAVHSNNQTTVESEQTLVTFAQMSVEMIDRYVATGEPLDKAGAYGIQGAAAQFIPRIEGDYSNVVGLPLARVRQMLEGAGLL
jgi:septum formation protein